ncbi:MAG: TetR family transcriptional regulator [Actinomycetota bacterium]
MLRMHTGQLIVVTAVTVASVGYMAYTIARLLSRPEVDGAEGLSMRKLAGTLGVEAMTLYHHFPNKDAILDGVVARVFAEMRMPEPLPEGWMALTEEMFVAFQRVLVEHPNTITLFARRPLNTADAADFVEAPLSVLAMSGLPPERVGQLYQSLVAYSLGHVIAHAPEDLVTPLIEKSAASRYPTGCRRHANTAVANAIGTTMPAVSARQDTAARCP